MENNKLKIYEIEGIAALKNWFASCKNIFDGQTLEDYQKNNKLGLFARINPKSK